MKNVILVGTSHSIQLGEVSPRPFKEMLDELCGKYQVAAIAEEIVSGSETIAFKLATDRQYSYTCADPDFKERKEKGIEVDIELNIISEFRDKYPEITIWPNIANENTLPTEVWDEYKERLETSLRQRESVWLDNIQSLNQWPLLFICGANHYDSFSKLLKSKDIEVIVSYKDWEPK